MRRYIHFTLSALDDAGETIRRHYRHYTNHDGRIMLEASMIPESGYDPRTLSDWMFEKEFTDQSDLNMWINRSKP